MNTSAAPTGNGRAYYVISTIGPDGYYKVLDVEAAPDNDQEADERGDFLYAEAQAACATVTTVYASSAAQAAQILRRDCA
ncbi:hypothetical protein [Streptomyces sp. NPDC020667]|uniref:hypothetical protein n=1 Tax=Streptomyces sp. NPDC020667 TaxID=3154895 RepID=UPI0033CEEE93